MHFTRVSWLLFRDFFLFYANFCCECVCSSLFFLFFCFARLLYFYRFRFGFSVCAKKSSQNRKTCALYSICYPQHSATTRTHARSLTLPSHNVCAVYRFRYTNKNCNSNRFINCEHVALFWICEYSFNRKYFIFPHDLWKLMASLWSVQPNNVKCRQNDYNRFMLNYLRMRQCIRLLWFDLIRHTVSTKHEIQPNFNEPCSFFPPRCFSFSSLSVLFFNMGFCTENPKVDFPFFYSGLITECVRGGGGGIKNKVLDTLADSLIFLFPSNRNS